MTPRLLALCFGPALLAVTSHAQTTPALQHYLKASNPDAGDEFYTVAGDGGVVVVGAHLEDGGANQVNGDQSLDTVANAGAAYVWRRVGSGAQSTWAQEAYLKPSNPGATDEFGASVSISGDWIAVGAPYEDSSATGQGGNQADNGSGNSGAVYIFRREVSGAWVQEAYLKPEHNHPGCNYGYSVALDNGLLVVGAYHDSSNAVGINGTPSSYTVPSSGAAYVYRRTLIFGQPAWLLEAYIKPPQPYMYDYFGHSVAVSGTRVVVGSPGEDSGPVGINGTPDQSAPSAGAAYVYSNNGGTGSGSWSLNAFLKASNAGYGDDFGTAVAIDGTRVAVGAPNEDSAATGVNGNEADNSAQGAGAVYLFSSNTPIGQIWQQAAYVKAQYAEVNGWSWFGSSVALKGDRLLVGSVQEHNSSTGVNPGSYVSSGVQSGAAYLFSWQAQVTQAAYIKPPVHYYMAMGGSVAIAGTSAFVGAQWDSSDAVGVDGDWQYGSLAHNSGSVFVYSDGTDCDNNWVPDATELAARDCNQNGTMDGCEIVAGATDCDGNMVPDVCQPDVNADGVADACQGGIGFCFGLACPCGNNTAAGRGCGNSQNAGGAYLASSGLPSLSHDSLVLVGSGMTVNSNVLYFQGTAQGSGTAFGDGLRCATGSVVRLGATTNVQGQSFWPRSGYPAIHIGGNVPATGGLRTYQAWYRDPSTSFCSASTFNLTNGVRVQWVP